jgi:putative heme-binding domain-containing protein
LVLQLGTPAVAGLICILAGSRAQTAVLGIDGQEESSQGLPVERRTFESSCAPCHGLNGKGAEHGPDIAARSEVVTLSDSETLKVLREGRPQAGMPAFAALGPAGLSDVLRYLRFLQGKRRAPALAASAARGKAVFTGKAGCSECHMVHGRGGFLGPDLSDYGASHSGDDIRNAIVSADKRAGFRKGLANATTKDGRRISGLVRNEDNFSVQLQGLDGAFYLLERSDLADLTFDPAPLMPDNDGSKLSQSDLDQLVGYLLSVAEVKREREAAASK